MVNIHMIIGLGEAAITGVVVAAILRLRPDLLTRAADADGSSRHGSLFRGAALGAVPVIACLLFLAPFASPLPDGLEKVVQTLGVEHPAAPAASSPGILAEYRFPGVPSTTASTLLAGGIGTIVVFGLSLLLGRTLSRDHGVS
jgi:cobalt/nickel transport system permease protein